MKFLASYPAKVIVVGFVVLVLLSMPLFWARFLCEAMHREMVPKEARRIFIQPCLLVPKEIENDPNVDRPSRISSVMRTDEPFALGVVDYFAAREPEGRLSNIYDCRYEPDQRYRILYFDEGTGLIVYHRRYKERLPDRTTVRREIRLYAGPRGVSETPGKTLGKFTAPITDSGEGYRTVILFDKKLRRFFTIDLDEKTVAKGPKLARDDPHNPVQVGGLIKNWRDRHSLECHPPCKKVIIPPDEDESEKRRSRRSRKPEVEFHPVVRFGVGSPLAPFLLVLDETGRIDLLDRYTLEFAGTAGYLPAPEAIFGVNTEPRPEDLLSYRALPVTLGSEHQYRGMCVASVSREGSGMALAVFNEKGHLIRKRHSRAARYGDHFEAARLMSTREYIRRRRDDLLRVPSGEAAFSEVPGGYLVMVAKFLLENLQPSILSVASYLTAGTFEAAAGHRALFILPNSFIAMAGREVTDEVMENVLFALLLISPSIVLSIFLARAVARNAALVGLSENARLWWIIITVAFGLTAYITYRLTRPRIALVTCANCGQLRRPDMARCHRCGSKWQVPELTAPEWRVVDEERPEAG